MVRSFLSSFYALSLALGLTCLLVVGLVLTGAEQLAGANSLAATEIYLVNSLADDIDADLTDGLCRTPGGACTLRAAIMQANAASGVQTITLPSGVFSLTRVGADDTALAGDLDVTSEIAVEGAGPGLTIIDGNGSITDDRVFHILPDSKLVLRGLTIRNGSGPVAKPRGGGFYCQGPGNAVILDHVVVEGNHALVGGGAAIEYCNATFLDSAVRSNSATTATLFSQVALPGDPRAGNQPRVTDKIVPIGVTPYGGGLYLEGIHLTTLARSEVVSNTSPTGGGIMNEQLAAGQGGRLRLIDSAIRGNLADSGGGIENRASLQLLRATLDRNTATGPGGALLVLLPYDTAEIDIADSTFTENRAQDGGGLAFLVADTGRAFVLRNSTLNGNVATRDGGAIFAPSGVYLSAMNTTIDGNAAGRSGGALSAEGASRIWLANVTVTDNRLDPALNPAGPWRGNGLFITATAAITAQNTILAGNVFSGTGFQQPSECVVNPTTSLRLNAYNLIQNFAGCLWSGTSVGLVTGLDPQLASLANNGGWTRTRAPFETSPAVNQGNPNGCRDFQELLIGADQRGLPRASAGRCDLGAVESLAGPTLTAVSPAQVPARPAFTLVLTGENLIPNTLVLWNGTTVPATSLDGQHLTVTIPTNLVPATGPYPISAQYGTLTSPIPSIVTVTVTMADQLITFGALPPHAFNDPPFLVSAIASSGLPVSFLASGVCSVSGNLVTPTGVGSCTLIASQPGNALYHAAPPNRQTFPIGPAIPRPIFIPRAGKE